MSSLKPKLIHARNRLGATFNHPGPSAGDISIISNDCWGGSFYQEFQFAYRTPFVGLAIMVPCFVKLAADFKCYLHSPLRVRAESKYPEMNRQRKLKGQDYPIGVLGDDVELHMFHYKSEEEALAKWQRRLERVNMDNLAFKLSGGKDGATPELLATFARLPFKKKLILAPDPVDLPCAVQVKNYVGNGAMMFHRSLAAFDLSGWVRNGTVRRSPRSWVNGILYSFGA